MAIGENNNLPVRIYQEEFRELLKAVFENRSTFSDFFGGGIEALDGISNGDTAFNVRTSDIPVIVGEYSIDPAVAFEAGTANTTRFGNRKEIIYESVAVEYTWNWAIHEGIDRFTVNNDMDAAIADRLDLQAQAKVNEFNAKHSAFISTNAGKSEALTTYEPADVLALFNLMSSHFTNIQAIGDKVANVNTQLYNAIVDHPFAVREKASSANIDNNTILKFKGFEIVETPDSLFQPLDAAYAYVKGVGKAFTGINTVRTIESEDFDGVALQAAGKAGQFIPEDNKKAVFKVTAPAAG